jgi:polyisoprenyl-phosphate glycosyltransferase
VTRTIDFAPARHAAAQSAPRIDPFGRAFGVKRRLALVTPVLDDWESFALLIERIALLDLPTVEGIEVVAVDDGSVTSFDPASLPLPRGGLVHGVGVVRLALNLGHQRAIAAGLVTLSGRTDLDAVIVMDSDGEDRPEDIPALLEASAAAPGRPILAHRAQRSETRLFRAGYRAYQFLFRLLTGRGISFGNYSVLPMEAVRRLVYMPELWNNLPAAIMRSRLPFRTVATTRGVRYAGQSKMNLASLVIHGLSAMSVYTDLIFIRILLGAGGISVLAVLAIGVVVAIRFGTTLAIPGWATTVLGDLVIILFQAILTIVATSLMVLAGRSSRPTVPVTDAPTFVRSVSDMIRPFPPEAPRSASGSPPVEPEARPATRVAADPAGRWPRIAEPV